MMIETIQLINIQENVNSQVKICFSKALGPETYFINIQMESIISDQLLYC